ELGDEARHHSRQEGVVGAEPAQDLALGTPEAGVERVDLAAVGLTAPPREPVAVGADDIDASVGGAAVEDDVLDRLVVLREHGLDRLFEELRLVVGRGDDAHERRAQRPQCIPGPRGRKGHVSNRLLTEVLYIRSVRGWNDGMKLSAMNGGRRTWLVVLLAGAALAITVGVSRAANYTT